MNKIDDLKSLVLKRRLAHSGTLQDGYTRDFMKLGDFHDGVYDSDNHVVPYSKTAFNINAEIFIIGQDWASENFLSKPVNFDQIKFGYDQKLPTNIRLFALLRQYLNVEFRETYATDILFLSNQETCLLH